MKRTYLAVILFGLVAGSAWATNSTSATASLVRPDGSAVTENFTTAGGPSAWFSAPLIAGHSYVAEVEAPFNGAASLAGGASPTLTLGIFRNDGSTPTGTATDISSCAPATGSAGSRMTFTPSATDVAGGALKISVTNGVAPDYSFRFRLYETGLSCPRWSVNGYQSFVNLQNTSDCALTLSLIFYKPDGTIASTTPVSLPANGATQISYPAGTAIGGTLIGSAAVFHNGAKGAVTGGIYQVNNAAAGANYLWPFTEIRSSGSTSGQ